MCIISACMKNKRKNELHHIARLTLIWFILQVKTGFFQKTHTVVNG
jgi:hypothetical protein